MIKYDDEAEGRLIKELPLKDSEDGVLIIIDRANWQIKVFYEGSVNTLNMLDGFLDTAKEMFREKKEDQVLEEEKREEQLN